MGHVVSARQLTLVSGRLWETLLNEYRVFMSVHTQTYRPELHYMRGPGPKCREKTQHQRKAHSKPIYSTTMVEVSAAGQTQGHAAVLACLQQLGD